MVIHVKSSMLTVISMQAKLHIHDDIIWNGKTIVLLTFSFKLWLAW